MAKCNKCGITIQDEGFSCADNCDNVSKTTHQVFLAVYKTQTIFHVPKGVRLLSLDDNKNAGNVAGSWYIKWDKLIYLDKDLKEVEIDGDEFEMDKKRPDEITEEDEEEDEEEEPDCQEEHDKEHALEKKINLTVGA
jgi:hypothetical protein